MAVSPGRVSGAPGATLELLLAGARAVAGEAAGPWERDPGAWRDAAVRHAADAAWARGDLAAVRALAAGYDALLLHEPRRQDGDVVLVAVGNSERRHRGAFGTPPVLATALACRALPDPVPAPLGQATARPPLVVDPACGAGALLRAALARLLALGVPAATVATCLHGVDTDPVAVALCRAVLAADLVAAGHPATPADLAGHVIVADALVEPPAGLDWPGAFPAALARPGEPPEPVSGWRGGFDAVVANPPWERLKVHARDWAGNPPSRLRGVRAETARAVRDGGRHPLTGVGELNAYLPFVETCWRLLAPSGRAAVLVPAGIASDRSAARLVEELARSGSLDRLHLMEPPEPVFDGVSSRVPIAIVELRGGPPRDGGGTEGAGTDGAEAAGAEVAVGLTGPDAVIDGRAWRLDAPLLRLVNPNTGTAPLFGSARDARIVTGVHRRWPVLIRRHAAEVENPWSLRLVTPFHMTRDAPLFRPGSGDGLLPLWEAKHAGLLDPHGGTRAGHRYWVPEDAVRARYGDLCERGWLAGYRNVTVATAPRTLLPAPLPVVGVGNSFPLMTAPRLPLLLAALASLPVDYVARQKHAGANLNFFKLEQVPLPPPEVYDRPAPWDPSTTAAAWVLARFARAVAWVPGLAGLAAELRGLGVPVPGTAATPEALPAPERADALAEIDAAHAVLLGLERAEVEQVLSTFGALRAREERTAGHFATETRVLTAYDALT